MIYESAQSNPFSAAYVYQLPQTVGGVTAMQFTVDSTGEYGFKVLGANGEGLLEIQKQGTVLMGKTPSGSFVQLKNGTPKVSVYTCLLYTSRPL